MTGAPDSKVEKTVKVPQVQAYSCSEQGKSSKTKPEREALKVHVEEGSPDIQKFVLWETANEHPGADTDDGVRTRSVHCEHRSRNSRCKVHW